MSVPASHYSDTGGVRKTRFKELGYVCIVDRSNRFWQHVAHNGDSTVSQVGPQYPTEKQLLADHERYAAFYGCDGANATLLHNPDWTGQVPRYGTMTVYGPRDPNGKAHGYYVKLHRPQLKSHENIESDRFPSIEAAVGRTVSALLEMTHGTPLTLTFIDSTDK